MFIWEFPKGKYGRRPFQTPHNKSKYMKVFLLSFMYEYETVGIRIV